MHGTLGVPLPKSALTAVNATHFTQLELALLMVGLSSAPFHVIFPVKAEYIVYYNSVQMFPLKFSADTGLKGRNKKALAFLAMILNELMQKNCNTHDGTFWLLGLPLPLYSVFLCY